MQTGANMQQCGVDCADDMCLAVDTLAACPYMYRIFLPAIVLLFEQRNNPTSHRFDMPA